jgi:hypothetical protein
MHSCLYEFLRDQGSLIAGILALIAGIFAYRAGKIQARATRESAHIQTAAQATAETNANTAAAEAIIREIIECNKVVIEGLRICEYINAGQLLINRRNGYSIMMNPDPVVYKAVANRIALLSFDAQLVIQFYMRIVYVQQQIQIIVFGPGDNNATVPKEEAEILAKNLIITCQLARAIILRSPSTSVAETVSRITLAQIDAALESAKQSFPKLFPQQGGCEQGQGEGQTIPAV